MKLVWPVGSPQLRKQKTGWPKWPGPFRVSSIGLTHRCHHFMCVIIKAAKSWIIIISISSSSVNHYSNSSIGWKTSQDIHPPEIPLIYCFTRVPSKDSQMFKQNYIHRLTSFSRNQFCPIPCPRVQKRNNCFCCHGLVRHILFSAQSKQNLTQMKELAEVSLWALLLWGWRGVWGAR